MKKILEVILAGLIAMSLCACAEEPSEDGRKNPPETEGAAAGETEGAEEVEKTSYTFEFKSEEREYKLSDSLSATVKLYYDLYGNVSSAETVSGASLVDVLNDGYLVLYTRSLSAEVPPQVWLVNIADGTAEGLLPDELFGHTYEEYYESVNGERQHGGPNDYAYLCWCDSPVLNGDTLDGLQLAYYCNAYADEDGNITNPETCWKNGAIWLYDFGTKTVGRIDPQGCEVSGDIPSWATFDVVSYVADGRYFNYSEGKGLTDTEMSCDELSEILSEDEKFDAFLRHGIVETDTSDSIEADGETYYRVTDERFDTEEHFNASMKAHYSDSFIEQGYAAGGVKFSDGKTYCRAADEDYTGFPQYVSIEEAWLSEGVYGEDQYFCEFRATAYTNPTALGLKEVNRISLEKDSEGNWKVSYTDRNVVATGKGWVNVPEGLPVTASELEEILKRDEVFNGTVLRGYLGVDSGATMTSDSGEVYCKVVDEVFSSAEKLDAFIGQTYTGGALEEMTAKKNEHYTESDGELYVAPFEADITLESPLKSYTFAEFSDESVTVISYGGYTGENDDRVCAHTFVINKTADGWRIADCG